MSDNEHNNINDEEQQDKPSWLEGRPQAARPGKPTPASAGVTNVSAGTPYPGAEAKASIPVGDAVPSNNGDATSQRAGYTADIKSEPQKKGKRSIITDFLNRINQPASTPSAESVAGADGQSQTALQADQAHPCIIIGPSRSGKTFFLLAIGQACYQPGADDIDLEFAPRPPATPGAPAISDLMKRSVEIITGKDSDREGTTAAFDYSFDITAKGKFPGEWGKRHYFSSTMTATVSDGPGGALFQEESNEKFTAEEIRKWYDNLVPKAREASSFIFCVDATSPQLKILAKNLPMLIQDIALDTPEPQIIPHDQGVLDQLWGSLAGRKPPTRLVNRRRLKADRFLLLLTKVDRLCAQSGRKERPDLLATMIDPVEQAKRTLSKDILERIRQTLKPSAKFAVGVASALGFHPENGLPLANDQGFVRKGKGTEREDEILRAWTPFGVREAMFFIATGYATGSVREVNRKDLED